jgi:hypothetical protein
MLRHKTAPGGDAGTVLPFRNLSRDYQPPTGEFASVFVAGWVLS